MKYRMLATEGLSVHALLDEVRAGQAVFLTEGGEVTFVVMPADEGDMEVCAMRNNAAFMAYLDECTARAMKGPRYSLEEVKAHLGISGTSGVGAPPMDVSRNEPLQNELPQ